MLFSLIFLPIDVYFLFEINILRDILVKGRLFAVEYYAIKIFITEVLS